MATGRVGGTRSKISGKVGDDVYTVRREGDGSYDQVVAPMPESREDTLTPEVVEQRMIMSICYRYMKAIPFVLNSAFKSNETKSLNLQEFVRINVPILRKKMKELNPLVNPIYYYQYGDENIYPAPVKIGGYGSIVVQSLAVMHGYIEGEWYNEFQFGAIMPGWSVGYWIKHTWHEIGDVILMLVQMVDDDPSRNNIYFCRFIVNPKIPLTTSITDANFLDIFDIESQVGFNLVPRRSVLDNSVNYGIRFTKSVSGGFTDCGGAAVIYSGLRKGVWQRSEAFMGTWKLSGESSHLRKDIADVWDSWYTDRLND